MLYALGSIFPDLIKILLPIKIKKEELSGRPPHQRKRERREGGSGIPFGMSHNKHPLFKSGSIYYEICDRTLTLKKKKKKMKERKNIFSKKD